MTPKRKTKSYTLQDLRLRDDRCRGQRQRNPDARKFVDDATKAPTVLEFSNTSPFHNPLIVVIYRDMHSWCYRFSDSPCTHSGMETADRAERCARSHAAQMLCVIPDNARLELILDKVDQSSHQSWFNWQCR